MDEQTESLRIKRRRNRTEIEQLVAEYAASGMSRTAFCQQRGLSLSTLSRYQKRREQFSAGAAEGKGWLAVEVSGTAVVAGVERPSGLTVVLPGERRIEIARGFDAETLQRLLAVVERG